MKYLGMILGNNSTFNEHIEYIHSKSVKKLDRVRNARDFLDRKTSVLLYESLVLPHLDYCNTIYRCTSATNLEKLQKIQNGACRTLLLADKMSPIKDMHQELGLLNFSQRPDLHLAVDSH